MPSPALHTLFRKESFSPRSAGPGGFLRLPVGQSLSLWERWHCEAMTERASPSPKSRRAAISCLFVRAILSPRLRFSASVLALSITFGDTARVAAPSVCFAAARILLAAAPTAPPCFRHWRRSSPLLPRGEPFHLHDTAPLRWNKWRSSYKLNDTSLNISCSPTWRSSPDWRSTYFASWAQVRHLGEVRFTALVR